MMEENTFSDPGPLGQLSTGPISVVSVVSAVAEANPDDFFRILSPIPDTLAEMILFEFNTYAWGIDEQSRPAFCDRLRYLRVISNIPTDLLHTREGQRSVLISLIEHCPTLGNVTLTSPSMARSTPFIPAANG